MKKLELWAGSALWIALSLTMVAAALEPVELRAAVVEAQPLSSLADCVPQFTIGYETVGL
jgi:hypothetical protein